MYRNVFISMKTTFRRNEPGQHGFMDGLSLHYYTHPGGWLNKGSATEFDEKKHEDNLIKLGEKEGREKERMKNICSMLALSLSPEIIAKACEVSVDYVLNLKKELER